MVKFVTGSGSRLEILEIDVDRETVNFVWIDGVRRSKESNFELYHDSWREAHDYLKQRADNNLRAAKAEVSRRAQVRDAIHRMKKPADA